MSQLFSGQDRVSPILAYGVKPTGPQGASAPGFSSCVCLCYYAIIKVFEL